MKVSDSLQNYLDFGIYRISNIDYIEGKNAEIVMSGDCYDEESGEDGEFDILDVQNGKFIKAIITGTNLTCRYLTKEEIIELQSDLESYDDEETDGITITIDIDEILDRVSQATDISDKNFNKSSIENWERNNRYERVEQIRKSSSDTHNLDAYYDSLHQLNLAVFGDLYNNEFPIVNDTSYSNLKKLMRKCWANFTCLDSEQQMYVSNSYNDVRLSLISQAPLVEDEDILAILENYKSHAKLMPLDNKLFAEARKKIILYREIYEKIDVNKEYKRSKFIKEILQNYPNDFDNMNHAISAFVTPEALLRFWHMYGKIYMYKKGWLYYFHKGCRHSNEILR